MQTDENMSTIGATKKKMLERETSKMMAPFSFFFVYVGRRKVVGLKKSYYVLLFMILRIYSYIRIFEKGNGEHKAYD